MQESAAGLTGMSARHADVPAQLDGAVQQADAALLQRLDAVSVEFRVRVLRAVQCAGVHLVLHRCHRGRRKQLADLHWCATIAQVGQWMG